jgi:tetratricopeptide (TPR) repeat protein
MKLESTILGVLATALVAAGSASWAAGGSAKTETAATPERTPAQVAADHYNRAIDHRERAWELEAGLDAATAEAERTKLTKKVRAAYENAIEELRRAVAADPGLHEAWSDLGYAYRKNGRYAEALASYDRALTIDPGYAQAIEYRAEAYLGLGRIDDAKQSYAELVAKDPALAAQLLDAMRSWVAHQRAAGKGGSDAAALDSWIAEQKPPAQAPAGPKKARGW